MSIDKLVNLDVTTTGVETATEKMARLRKETQATKNETKAIQKEIEGIKKKGSASTEELSKGFNKANTAANRLRGGYEGVVSQIFSVAKAAKISGAAMRSALISTGIGALIVALGLIIDNWDAISDAITGTNEELEEQLRLQQLISLELDRRVKDNQRDLKNQRSREKIKILRAKIAGADEKVITEIKRKGFIERQQIAEDELKEAKVLAKKAGLLDEETNAAAQKEQERAYKALSKAKLDAKIFDLEQQLPEDEKTGGTGKRRPKETTLLDKVDGVKTSEEHQSDLDKESERFAEMFDLKTYQAEALAGALLEIEESAYSKEEKLSKAKILVAEFEAEAKAEALDFYANALSSVSNLIGTETAAGKAFAVASTLMSTYLSAQKAYESQFMPLATVDAPVRGAIAAGIAVANGLANVKAILSVKTPAGGGGSGGVGGGVSAPKAPSFNVVGNSGVSQIGQTLNQEQEPIQAYVVSGNVTTQQELDRNIVDTATIG